jgi:quinol monooxygenase YgiN
MRRRDDGWDDGRRDWGNDDGWQDSRAGGAHGDDRNGSAYNSSAYNGGGYNGQARGHGRPEYPDYPGTAGPREPAAADWERPAREATSAGYDGRTHGGQAAGEVTRVERAFQDSSYDGYPANGYRQQPNFQSASGTPAELSPGEAPRPKRPGTPRPYGRLSIYTLLDDKTAEFDELAEEAAEGVRTSEPDTLVYVIHVVPKAPMQRIIYEIYRDRSAFEDHENQPHIKRFTEARKSCVLATNIIDLRLRFAKVAALFQDGQQVGRSVEQDSWPDGAAAPSQSPQRTPRALEAGLPPAGGGDYPAGQQAGDQYATAQYTGARYGDQYNGADQYNGSQYNGAGQDNGAGRYNGGRHNGAGQDNGAGRYNGGQHNGAGQYDGGRYNGGAQYNAGSQYGNQYANGGQYDGAYGSAGQYNGGQYNGGQYNGGQYNGGQYNGAGQYQRYGEGDGGYPDPQGPAPGQRPALSQGPKSRPKAQGRPPWDDTPDWGPSPHPDERYGG